MRKFSAVTLVLALFGILVSGCARKVLYISDLAVISYNGHSYVQDNFSEWSMESVPTVKSSAWIRSENSDGKVGDGMKIDVLLFENTDDLFLVVPCVGYLSLFVRKDIDRVLTRDKVKDVVIRDFAYTEMTDEHNGHVYFNRSFVAEGDLRQDLLNLTYEATYSFSGLKYQEPSYYKMDKKDTYACDGCYYGQLCAVYEGQPCIRIFGDMILGPENDRMVLESPSFEFRIASVRLTYDIQDFVRQLLGQE